MAAIPLIPALLTTLLTTIFLATLTLKIYISQDQQTITIEQISPGIAPITIGTVSLPLAFLCSAPVQQSGLNTILNGTCIICNLDCRYVHNTYGGSCGINPEKTSEQTCLCADDQTQADDRKIYTSTTQTCNLNVYERALVAPIKEFLLTRLNADLCKYNTLTSTYDSSGCNQDCVGNHGYTSGTCLETVPLVTADGDTATLHCQCARAPAPAPASTD